MRKRQLIKNAALGTIQVVITGAGFVVLYRFLYDTIGVAELGVWSVVLSWTSISSLAGLGMTGSAVKFVSQYLARDDRDHVVSIIETTIVSLAVVLTIALIVVYPLLMSLVPVVFEGELQGVARQIVPYAVVSFWVTSLAGLCGSCLDGFHRVDLRHILLIAAMMMYLLLAFVLVPVNGIIGLAQAQVMQAMVLLIVTWIFMRRMLPELSLVPKRWRRSTLKEVLSYSLKLQAISVAQLLFEPTAKSLLARFGGASAAGFFEMANRMVTQLRALIVTAQQAMVPTIADLQERDQQKLVHVYAESLKLAQFVVVPVTPLFVLATPLICLLWLGEYAPQFVLFANMLFVAWFINILSGPAYFANMGTGDLRWNIIGQITTGSVCAVLGVVLGLLFGGTGVVLGFAIAIIVGALAVLLAYHKKAELSFSEFTDKKSKVLVSASVLGFVVAYSFYMFTSSVWGIAAAVVAALLILTAVIAIPVWRHPMRSKVHVWMTEFFRPRTLKERPL